MEDIEKIRNSEKSKQKKKEIKGNARSPPVYPQCNAQRFHQPAGLLAHGDLQPGAVKSKMLQRHRNAGCNPPVFPLQGLLSSSRSHAVPSFIVVHSYHRNSSLLLLFTRPEPICAREYELSSLVEVGVSRARPCLPTASILVTRGGGAVAVSVAVPGLFILLVSAPTAAAGTLILVERF